MVYPTLFGFLDEQFTAQDGDVLAEVWLAAEKLVSANLEERCNGFNRLLELDAPRKSALISCLLITRLQESDIGLRTEIVKSLGELLGAGDQTRIASVEIRQFIRYQISQIRRRGVFAVLQVAEADPVSKPFAARILNACPYAGRTMLDILSDRKMDFSIRHQAAYFIGEVGFLEAKDTLERLAARLETRARAQTRMPFAPQPKLDESRLLPAVQQALTMLSA